MMEAFAVFRWVLRLLLCEVIFGKIRNTKVILVKKIINHKTLFIVKIQFRIQLSV